MKKTKTSGILTGFVLLFFTIHVNAMQGLNDLLESFDNYQADFAQETRDQDGRVVQKMTGVIVLQKPDHFYWESDEPFAQKLIGNGQMIWHFDKDLEQVVVQQYSDQREQTPMLLMLEDSERLAQAFEVLEKAQKPQDEVHFRLRALDDSTGLRYLNIYFADGLLAGLHFVDQLDQATEVTFSNRRINLSIEASLFTFAIPEGVDVVYE